MKRNALSLLVVVATVAVVAGFYSPRVTLGADAAPSAGDGKAVFLAQKCDACHSIASQSIEQKLKGSKAPDLSNVGSVRDAAWIERWLKKEEKLDGKPHRKTFEGTDEERATVAKWLASQKDTTRKAP